MVKFWFFKVKSYFFLYNHWVISNCFPETVNYIRKSGQIKIPNPMITLILFYCWIRCFLLCIYIFIFIFYGHFWSILEMSHRHNLGRISFLVQATSVVGCAVLYCFECVTFESEFPMVWKPVLSSGDLEKTSEFPN